MRLSKFELRVMGDIVIVSVVVGLMVAIDRALSD